MSAHWQLRPSGGNSQEYDWPETTTLVDHMRGGFFKVSHLMYFLEFAVGHSIGNPDGMAPEGVLEIAQGLTKLHSQSVGLVDTDVVEYPAPLEEFAITYAELHDLEATFRFAAEHHMVVEAY